MTSEEGRRYESLEPYPGGGDSKRQKKPMTVTAQILTEAGGENPSRLVPG